jgi:predicted Zn-ribbon and HTH transcriptional regulator
MKNSAHIVAVHCETCGYRTKIDIRFPARCPHGPKNCYMPLRRD